MLTEELHAAGVAEGRTEAKIGEHEDAAHEKRNWVRLTYECNNRCVFCLDSNTHDGEMRDPEDVKRQILDGRKKGASRLILSGGEPTIHPRYVDFIKLGRLAGYRRIQTVTNGRLFRYPEFLRRCLEAGLQEITFSIHGPNAKIHDALVGVKGAYEEEMEGLRAALADGRPIINVDVVINRGNIKTLPDMLEGLYREGVREFDLLQVVPFGRAFTEGRDTLFYDLDAHAEYIRRALAFSERPDVHVWVNRFPPAHLEGYEHLIQDPYKLNDEVRGRKEEFLRQLDEGVPLECREPSRCRYCYLQRLCDTLEAVQRVHGARRFSRLVLDAGWEASLPAVFGGDPASARRARQGGGERGEAEPKKRGLPVLGGSVVAPRVSFEELTRGVERLVLRAASIEEARELAGRVPGAAEFELELPSWTGGLEALVRDGASLRLGSGDPSRPAGPRLVRASTARADDAAALLAHDADFEVEVLLNRETGPFLLSLPVRPSRLALRQPTYERLTEAGERDLDAPEFFAAMRARWGGVPPVLGLPACVIGAAPAVAAPTFDGTMASPDGQLEIFRYTRRYILDHYRVKSLRCAGCVERDRCDGLHINQVRAHGFAWMRPIAASGGRAQPNE
jgi:MoaA/NifB/PqqE/SkfB family radical SAM enzyme